MPSGLASDYLGSLGIVGAAIISGAGLGLYGGMVALEVATGDARGCEMLFLGLVIISSIGASFVVGLVLAFRWLRSRPRRQGGTAT
ncbi:hypothetical protein [Paracoccus sp. PAMC 22219]|uniref:hypothetical protein n=1 Tax=Paracoccus sp. PAMC 22219 TaxID=1569209 RepID=UPI0005A99550|nr:hypothetical protein [Paracoccus sp. PAMC 22219]